MSLTDYTIPRLSDGVSQEPKTIRSSTHLEEQINGVSDINKGLTKRNGSELEAVKQLLYKDINENLVPLNLNSKNTFVKTLKGVHYAGGEFTYQVIIKVDTEGNSGTAYIHHITGATKGAMYEVLTSNYLYGSVEDFKVVVDGNKVFILNKSVVVVGTDSDSGAFDDQGSLVNVNRGYLGTDYIVDVRLYNEDKSVSYGQLFAKHSTADTGAAGVKTSAIAQGLKDKLLTDQTSKITSFPKLGYINIAESYSADTSYLNLNLMNNNASGWTDVALDPNSNTLVAVSSNMNKDATIRKSTDGITWTDVVTTVKRTYTYITFVTLGSLATGYIPCFIAGGTDGSISYSTDGIDWVVKTSGYAWGTVHKAIEWNGDLIVLRTSAATPTNSNYQLLLYRFTSPTVLTEYQLGGNYITNSNKHLMGRSDIYISSDNRLNVLAYWVDGYGQSRYIVPAYSSITWNGSFYFLQGAQQRFDVPMYASAPPPITSMYNRSVTASTNVGSIRLHNNSGNVYTDLTVTKNIYQAPYSLLSNEYLSTASGGIIKFTSNFSSYILGQAPNSERIKKFLPITGSKILAVGVNNLYTFNIGEELDGTKWVKIEEQVLEKLVLEVSTRTSGYEDALYGINRVVADPTQLPRGPEGYTVLVDSDAAEDKDNYYLEYDISLNIWREAKRLGLTSSISDNNLPLVIEDTSKDPSINADFIKNFSVKDRTSGDSESNPLPSFVNKKINDIFLANNRFGILSGSNVILSRIDAYDTFFRTANSTLLVSDRIDIKADLPSSRGTDLLYAVPYDNQILISSETAQSSLITNNAFDPKTSSLKPLTEYNIYPKCAPINLGQSIYLTVNRNSSSSIFELHRSTERGMQAPNVTKHIPIYLQGVMKDMTASTTEGIVFCRTNYSKKDVITGLEVGNTRDTVFVQNRASENGQLVQNAWHKWTLYDEDILGIDVVDNKLFITSVDEGYNTEMYVHSVEFAVDELEDTSNLKAINFKPYLDRRTMITEDLVNTLEGLIVSTDINTQGYFVDAGSINDVVAVDFKGQIYRGMTAINTYATKLYNEGAEDYVFYVGFLFEHEFTFSEMVPTKTDGAGNSKVNLASKLLLRNIKLSFQDTGKFEVIVKPKGREEYISRYSGMIVGDPSATLGRINIGSGIYQVLINALSDAVTVTVRSNTPFPTSFNMAEWQGTLTTKSGRY